MDFVLDFFSVYLFGKTSLWFLVKTVPFQEKFLVKPIEKAKEMTHVSVKMHHYAWIFAALVAITDQTIRSNFIMRLLWCGLWASWVCVCLLKISHQNTNHPKTVLLLLVVMLRRSAQLIVHLIFRVRLESCPYEKHNGLLSPFTTSVSLWERLKQLASCCWRSMADPVSRCYFRLSAIPEEVQQLAATDITPSQACTGFTHWPGLLHTWIHTDTNTHHNSLARTGTHSHRGVVIKDEIKSWIKLDERVRSEENTRCSGAVMWPVVKQCHLYHHEQYYFPVFAHPEVFFFSHTLANTHFHE